jgi:hypothetical protein
VDAIIATVSINGKDQPSRLPSNLIPGIHRCRATKDLIVIAFFMGSIVLPSHQPCIRAEVKPFSLSTPNTILAELRSSLLSDQGLISGLHAAKSQFRRAAFVIWG